MLEYGGPPTSTKAGSRLASQTAMPCPTIQSTSPASQSRKPIASTAESVPIRMAAARGAPPIRIGSVSER